MNLATPSNFKADWYGWVTNQWSHVMLGQIVFSLAMLATYATGEFGSRAGVWLAIALAYVAWEVATNETGKWWDAVEDFVFVCCYGAGWVALVFKEVDPGQPFVVGDASAALPIIGLFAFHSVLGVLLRLERGASA